MEEQALYSIDENMTFSKTWAVTMEHVGMISDMVQRGIGKNASDVVRQAIEAFYKANEK